MPTEARVDAGRYGVSLLPVGEAIPGKHFERRQLTCNRLTPSDWSPGLLVLQGLGRTISTAVILPIGI